MSLIFSNLVVIKTLSSNHRMYNLYGVSGFSWLVSFLLSV